MAENHVAYFADRNGKVSIYTAQQRWRSRHTIVELSREQARELRDLLNVQLEGRNG